MPGHIEAPRIDRRTPAEVIEHGNEETAIVHGVLTRPAAAVDARIPGQQTPGQRPGTIGIHCQKALPIRHGIEPVLPLELRAAATPAVQRQHDRQPAVRRPGRDMHDIASQQPVMLEFKDMIARGKLRLDPTP